MVVLSFLFFLDCRNDYESELGTFQGAVPLNTKVFSETWEAIDKVLDGVSTEDTKIMTFCTGGIRCIKVNAYLKQKKGFKNVGTLRKGIIAYEKWVNEAAHNSHQSEEFEIVSSKSSNSLNDIRSNPSSRQSLFKGKNFLFDRRRMLSNDTTTTTTTTIN